LRRLIQKEVENALARRVLGSDFAEGERIMVTVDADRLAFERLAPALEESQVAETVTEVSQAA
jgi:ATP-dependent Clp protease ATP-binding subunit ClpA